MTYLNQRMQQLPGQANGPALERPVSLGNEADLVLWAAAQGQALSKLQIFSTMAKQVNEQQ
ncbi:hypothetical protein INH39_30385 [Massilia violaceinigra]|uniref:Uncharacterized protein n=1 Tax=Massilia violaceinigra TaxID=2045208 RepID=A0ABY4A4D4_9BURK|nr:hypothetical protein [Massilia violaceinigra]UOD29645.1 hypothetical protein INH39_30385 [Massilia violaceinigra]